MTSFGRPSKSFRARKGRSWILILTPFLRNSSERKSASNTPKSTTVLGVRFSELAGIERSRLGETESLPSKPLAAKQTSFGFACVSSLPYGLIRQATTSRIVLETNLLARHTHSTNGSRPRH